MKSFIFDELSQHAKRAPEREALVCGDHRISYADFDRISDQVAIYLRSVGVRRGDRIGVSMDKSAEYICAVFGIMKCGACYVPIDHESPVQRKLQILSNCGIRVLICSNEVFETIILEKDVPSMLAHAVLAGDKGLLRHSGIVTRPFEELLCGEGVFNRLTEISDRDLAYIMHTSGSTGNPKGVMVTHGNIAIFIEWCEDTFNIGPEDRILNTAPFFFDLSGMDLFNAVHSGATLAIVEDQRMINMVFHTIDKERVTFVSAVPTLFGAMVQTPKVFSRYDLSSIKTVVTGGALCPPIFMIKLHEYLPQAKLYNLYGPTEAAIYCLYHEIDADDLDENVAIPIGIPFENTEAFVMGPNGRRVSVGETGELVLRGSHISPGYYKDAEKTNQAFRDFTELPHLNEKVYYTGDIARQDENGIFHFLGRHDDLIKSRGYRIELNEIEIALSGLSQELQDFTAVAVPDILNENVIYAAVVRKKTSRVTEDEIKRFCGARIPGYMVPEGVLFLDALPKTSSGKISRKEIVNRILGCHD